MKDTLTKTLRSGFLIIAFSLTIKGVSAQTCGTPPTCDSLGYQQSSSDCDGAKRVLKCPFDTSKVFCLELPPPPETCKVGSILYSDKSCSKTVTSGKTAIGIVFDPNKRLAVALEQASSQMMWSPGGKYENVTSLSDCSDTSTVLACNPNGKDNSSKIVSQYGSSTSYATGYCASYSTSDTEARDWFLPSIEELRSIYDAKNYVNASLTLLGKPALTDSYYWSSTEYSHYNSWRLTMDYGGIGYGNKNIGYYVRAVVAF